MFLPPFTVQKKSIPTGGVFPKFNIVSLYRKCTGALTSETNEIGKDLIMDVLMREGTSLL
jgi:hypothetical protein